ncbi:hypothetical protein PIB30_036924 [Stylosanthes scabra]|uniref:Reverse transcriptase domain-containing protein n=1 Tax=Stylosanthes scabra TaxID=79078 RepID=A0ABU6SDP3_9FABA|nr:hypothetical protein [Stylosanthes scabra]
MLISNPNPDLLDLDLELERTLTRARQVRSRIEFENSLYSQTENLATDEISVDSSLSNSESENFFSPTHADWSDQFVAQIPWDAWRISHKHLKDFDVICATTRRTSGDEDAVRAFAFPFSLEGRAKDWYHSLSGEITAE